MFCAAVAASLLLLGCEGSRPNGKVPFQKVEPRGPVEAPHGDGHHAGGHADEPHAKADSHAAESDGHHAKADDHGAAHAKAEAHPKADAQGAEAVKAEAAAQAEAEKAAAEAAAQAEAEKAAAEAAAQAEAEKAAAQAEAEKAAAEAAAQAEAEKAEAAKTEDTPASTVSAAAMKKGKKVFTANCVACHQLTGKGLAGAFPPLVGSEWVLGDPARPVAIVLQGLMGEIEVKGQKYNNVMAGLGAVLKDKDVASVVTYIRNSWGNSASEVDVELVKRIRAKLKGKGMWKSPSEVTTFAKSL